MRKIEVSRVGELEEISSGEAVAEAMMVVQSLLLANGIRGEMRNEVKSDIRELMMKLSSGKCRQASAVVMAFLLDKYPDKFQNMVLLESHSDEGNWLENGWRWHDYFLVLGEDGVWYAGSPANYLGEFGESRLVRIIANTSMKYVLEKIKTIEGGAWPRERDVRYWMEEYGGNADLDGRYKKGELKMDCVYYDNGEVLWRTVALELGKWPKV